MVADVYSPSLGAIEQGTGNNNNSWGDFLNGALTQLDKGVAGYATFAVTGGNLAKDAVVPPAGPHPLAEMVVNFTGVLASNQTVTVPNVSKIWLVENACSGAFTLKFKTTAGTASAAIPQNGMAIVICDGANGMFVGLSTSLRDVQWLGADGTLAAPGLSFTSEPGSGLRRKSAGVLSLVIGGVEIATISATGIDVTAGLAISVGGVAPIPAGTEVTTPRIRAPAGWYLEAGQTITRAGDPALLAALTESFTANTNGTTTLSNVSNDLRFLGLEGSALEGVGMATNAVIVSITSTTIVMSIAATNTATGGAVTAFPYGNGDGSTTFVLPNANGTVAVARDNMNNSAANKVTLAGSGLDGTKLNAMAGNQTTTLLTANLPPYTPSGSVTTSVNISGFIGVNVGQVGSGVAAGANFSVYVIGNMSVITGTASSSFAGSNQGGTSAPFSKMPPSRIRNVMIKR